MGGGKKKSRMGGAEGAPVGPKPRLAGPNRANTFKFGPPPTGQPRGGDCFERGFGSVRVKRIVYKAIVSATTGPGPRGGEFFMEGGDAKKGSGFFPQRF